MGMGNLGLVNKNEDTVSKIMPNPNKSYSNHHQNITGASPDAGRTPNDEIRE
jgi:hypothetical protein